MPSNLFLKKFDEMPTWESESGRIWTLLVDKNDELRMINQTISQLFYSAPKSWPTGQLSLPHTLGITKTEKLELKHKTDEQISPVNSLEPWDQSDRQKHTKVEDTIFWKGRFWAQSETVKKWWKVIAVYSKLNPHVQMMVAKRGMNNLDEESWVM